VARLKNLSETILRGTSSLTSAAHHCENPWPELTSGKILSGEASIEIECLMVAMFRTLLISPPLLPIIVATGSATGLMGKRGK
jgi:hypothetical protein